jgi:hypothetical protein
VNIKLTTLTALALLTSALPASADSLNCDFLNAEYAYKLESKLRAAKIDYDHGVVMQRTAKEASVLAQGDTWREHYKNIARINQRKVNITFLAPFGKNLDLNGDNNGWNKIQVGYKFDRTIEKLKADNIPSVYYGLNFSHDPSGTGCFGVLVIAE